MVGKSDIDFSWQIRSTMGLDATAKKVLRQVCNTDPADIIFHRVSGSIRLSDSGKTETYFKIDGSEFLSHKIWVNEKERVFQPQFHLGQLWSHDYDVDLRDV